MHKKLFPFSTGGWHFLSGKEITPARDESFITNKDV